ncbi:GNAT family N-acetyltransferase [Endozoicomonas arenosclerae]|uniref:GNAT family N-acetyltransferase n=1 Tax=Endozoicomonas arenosclerae TaxID=1633495 RepID=UPI0009A13915|nr:GNAT family N-acetyltransferase [Endozoicomonas arenosclerae]
MSDLIIRRATDKDINSLPALMYELDRFHYENNPEVYRTPEAMHSERVERNIFDHYRSGKFVVFLAVVDGKEVGMVSGLIKKMNSITSWPKTVGFVNELVVLPELRGGQAATDLMAKIEQYFAEQGATEMGLNVSSFNERAQGLYKKLGYDYDSHLMIKPLAESRQ